MKNGSKNKSVAFIILFSVFNKKNRFFLILLFKITVFYFNSCAV